jgi:acyl carrier protein
MSPKEFILAELSRKGRLPHSNDVDDFDYRRSGHIDSIGLVKFVLNLERQFDIEFSEEEVGNPSFRIVGSLVKLVEAKLRAKSA